MGTRKPIASGAVKTLAGALGVSAVIAVATPMIKDHEGLRTNAYLDPVGIPTICFGETLGVKMGQSKTVAECEAMLAPRLEGFLEQMDKCTKVPGVPALPVKTQAAFLSFTYNAGAGTYCANIAGKRLNLGKLVEACDALKLYTKAGRPLKVLPGLVRRRQEEHALCMDGLREAGLSKG